jgi:hypothetical protein
MAEYDNTNRGAIWKNKKKETEKHPDFTGSLNVDGHDYWVSAWRRKDGAPDTAPALSFQVKLKDGQPRAAAPKRVGNDDMVDAIPF